MSKPSRRPNREARKEHKAKLKAAQKELRKRQREQGLEEPPQSGYNNSLCPWETVEEEQKAREDVVAGQLGPLRAMLPVLLNRLAKIKDPRNPKKNKHRLTVVLLTGLLSFVFQMASRREANRELSRPAFLETLQELFPELESLPHGDTLNRLLERIDVSELEQAHLILIRRFIRNKKFRRFLVSKCYPIAIDGTQKLARDGQWNDIEWLERRIETKDGEKVQQYVYVLEANLVFYNGLTIPLMSEFLSYGEGDPDDHKQDCELKAFKRLAERIKKEFPRLPVMVLVDGLYPNGPMMELCRSYRWHYMIVLPDKCLPSVWEEVEALLPLQSGSQRRSVWRGRCQQFRWVNDIDYAYDNGKKHISVHVVICEETWEEVDNDSAEIVTRQARHVWISSHWLTWSNVLERCNHGARRRWGIETNMLIEKHQGYNYEHRFSHNWNAMKGFHYLMRMAHMLNAIALCTTAIAQEVKRIGVQSFLKLVRESCANRWLSLEWIKKFFHRPYQLRLV